MLSSFPFSRRCQPPPLTPKVPVIASRLIQLAALGLSGVCGCESAPAPVAATADSATSDIGSVAAADTSSADAAVTDTASDSASTADAAKPDAAAGADAAPETTVADAADAAPKDAGSTDTTKAETATTDAGPADAAPTDAGTVDASTPVMCSGQVYSFPQFSKTCGSDSDCFIAHHQTDCCGSQIALGLAVSDKAAFEAAEQICGQQYPGCGCAGQPTLAEDGYSIGVNPVAVKCGGGTCATYIVTAKPECTTNGLQQPKPFKWCSKASDCAWVPHTIDCCGSQMAVGVAKASLAGYSAAEAECTKTAAICDCLSKPMVAEDGKTLISGDPVITCGYGACVTKAGP